MLKENFVEMIHESIKSHWDLPAFTDYEGESLSYGGTAEKIVWLHHIFQKSGIKRGDKIALIGKISTTWAIKRMCPKCSGVSRATITSLRWSFNTTSAARKSKLSL